MIADYDKEDFPVLKPKVEVVQPLIKPIITMPVPVVVPVI